MDCFSTVMTAILRVDTSYVKNKSIVGHLYETEHVMHL
jgi:hypothetical protein